MSNPHLRSNRGAMCHLMDDPEANKRLICLMLYLNQGWKIIECSRMPLRLHNLPDASTVGRMLYTLMEYVMYFVEFELVMPHKQTILGGIGTAIPIIQSYLMALHMRIVLQDLLSSPMYRMR